MEAVDRLGDEEHAGPDVLSMDARATAAYLREQRRRENAAAAERPSNSRQ